MARVAQVSEDGGTPTPSSSDDKAKINKRHSGAHLGESEADSNFGSSMPNFDIFPEFLRVGPWSISAYATLLGIVIWLLVYAGDAWESYKAVISSQVPETTMAVWLSQPSLLAYTVYVHVHCVKKASWWPYVSYTMAAYVLLTLRFALCFLGLRQLAEVLRFPCLVMGLITTSIWWLVLVPIFLVAMPGGEKARRRFTKFNFSFFLVNVHLFNSVLAWYDHWSTMRPLVLCDLWLAILFAFIYVLFYLLVLDPRGLHFYIILSPRPWWCCFCYGACIGVYVGIYMALQ
mmetsp:Transcript_52535/g.105445  ORF Transcript_52535/g.105445 Transcript_52535/m.105445 type:complete len:288 (+) Transcript_52535:120-983(+)